LFGLTLSEVSVCFCLLLIRLTIFVVVLVAMVHSSAEAKQQMLKEYKKTYRFNRCEMVKIDEFQKTYRACDAIRWYTKPCFLSNLVNKALRSANVHALYTFRYFIFDL
jgi:hypothetical protein